MEPEWAHSILEPHFDAVRDEFASFTPVGSARPLDRLRRVKYVVDEAMHDSERHFAGTRTDGMLMKYAPEIIDLPLESLVAILSHEFGHAADFAYPGCWSWPLDKAASSIWVGSLPDARASAWRQLFGSARAQSRTPADDAAPAAHWMQAWEERNADRVEWAADGISEAVTGRRPRYCGECMIQCYSGIERPAGLR